MAIINTGFSAYQKLSAFYKDRKIYNFAKCETESSVLRNPVLTIAKPISVIPILLKKNAQKL